jgi:hypothetical protein
MRLRCLFGFSFIFSCLVTLATVYVQAGKAELTGSVHDETKNLELRLEAFNVTNTPPLGAPNAVLASPGFGSITSAGDPRVIQLGIKLNF